MTQNKPQTLEELLKEYQKQFLNHSNEFVNPWKLKGNVSHEELRELHLEFEAFIKKVYEAGGEAEKERIEKGMKPALDDFTGMGKVLIKKGFEGAGNEVIENIGYIKSLFINQHKKDKYNFITTRETDDDDITYPD